MPHAVQKRLSPARLVPHVGQAVGAGDPGIPADGVADPAAGGGSDDVPDAGTGDPMDDPDAARGASAAGPVPTVLTPTGAVETAPAAAGGRRL